MTPGDLVQTPFGKGTVREVRNNGRVLVEVRGRPVLLSPEQLKPLDGRRLRRSAKGRASAIESGGFKTSAPPLPPRLVPVSIDLHGLTVEQALARAETALSDALMADLSEVRFVHGRSGGRIRAALHRWLRGIPAVRRFELDPTNEGVTVVRL